MEIREFPKLGIGEGLEGVSACWMSALNYLSGSEEWTDRAECVDPFIRGIAIVINDRCDDQPEGYDREELIGPHLMAPYGTNQGPEWTTRRARYFYTKFPDAIGAEKWLAGPTNFSDPIAHADAMSACFELKRRSEATTQQLLDVLLHLCDMGREEREDIERTPRTMAELCEVAPPR